MGQVSNLSCSYFCFSGDIWEVSRRFRQVYVLINRRRVSLVMKHSFSGKFPPFNIRMCVSIRSRAFFWMLCCPVTVRILVVLEFSAETSERTLEERLCVGWNSRNARSLLTARRAEDDRKSFSLVLGTQLCLWFIDTLMG